MRDIKEAYIKSCVDMFLDNSRILKGHIPTMEINYFSTRSNMKIVKRGFHCLYVWLNNYIFFV